MAQSGKQVKIPLTVNLHIEGFAGGHITRFNSGSTNLVYAQYDDGTWYATQRPGVNQFEDASATVADARGRGAYYWDQVADKYFVNNDTVYKSGYANPIGTISEGTQRVFMADIGDNLVIIDAENNEGWYITSSAPTTVVAISDANFPPNQTPALTLARGGCVLNGKLYVLTTNGDICESDIDDPTTWGALNFINAEVEPDQGVYIWKHHQHVVVFGTRSLEFFQDVGNPTGSTLAARTDVQYETGAIATDSLWSVGERLYFIGQDKSGAIGVYALDNFTLSKVSKPDMDIFLTTAIGYDGVKVLGAGFMSGGREFYVMTPYNIIPASTGDIVPISALVYSPGLNWWGFWDVYLPDVNFFPLMAWMPSTSSLRVGEGILSNGDLVTILDQFYPIDTVDASGVYVDAPTGPYDPDIYTVTGGAGTVFPFEIVTGTLDGGTPRRKFMGDLWLMCLPVSVSEEVTVAWADEQDTSYPLSATINVSDPDDAISRLGSFRRRNFKVTGTISEQIRMESLMTTVRVG